MWKITRLEILSVKQETVTTQLFELRSFNIWIINYNSRLIIKIERMLKNIQGVHSKGNQSWLFIGRSNIEAETPIFWPSDAKSWLIWKDPVVGKDWGQVEKGTTEDEMAGRHHWLNGHESGWTLGVGDGQGGLACCGSWGHRVGHDWATELNAIKKVAGTSLMVKWVRIHLPSAGVMGLTPSPGRFHMQWSN